MIRPADATSGWLPAAGLAVAAAVVLASYGTPVLDVAAFGAYVAFGVALPGMLCVRLLQGGPGHIAEDLALGLALGYALELATYMAARAAGAPLLFLAWPVATLVGFAAVPGLRQHWRGSGLRAPAWWSWSLAGLLAFVLWYSAATFFAQHALSRRAPGCVRRALAVRRPRDRRRRRAQPVCNAPLPERRLCRVRAARLGLASQRPGAQPARYAAVTLSSAATTSSRSASVIEANSGNVSSRS